MCSYPGILVDLKYVKSLPGLFWALTIFRIKVNIAHHIKLYSAYNTDTVRMQQKFLIV